MSILLLDTKPLAPIRQPEKGTSFFACDPPGWLARTKVRTASRNNTKYSSEERLFFRSPSQVRRYTARFRERYNAALVNYEDGEWQVARVIFLEASRLLRFEHAGGPDGPTEAVLPSPATISIWTR